MGVGSLGELVFSVEFLGQPRIEVFVMKGKNLALTGGLEPASLVRATILPSKDYRQTSVCVGRSPEYLEYVNLPICSQSMTIQYLELCVIDCSVSTHRQQVVGAIHLPLEKLFSYPNRGHGVKFRKRLEPMPQLQPIFMISAKIEAEDYKVDFRLKEVAMFHGGVPIRVACRVTYLHLGVTVLQKTGRIVTLGTSIPILYNTVFHFNARVVEGVPFNLGRLDGDGLVVELLEDGNEEIILARKVFGGGVREGATLSKYATYLDYYNFELDEF
ncbi:hypothetical protein SNEBB_007455 [Seison nebaliae]|nr:hypothetical protein SNEBB_007455 [Seison nebaliae]